jgi:hypothetical protein
LPDGIRPSASGSIALIGFGADSLIEAFVGFVGFTHASEEAASSDDVLAQVWWRAGSERKCLPGGETVPRRYAWRARPSSCRSRRTSPS